MNGREVGERIVEHVLGGESPASAAGTLRELRACADKLYMVTEGLDEDFFDALFQVLDEAVKEKLPPFQPGQYARVSTGSRNRAPFVVDACERAFGDWAVKGHFLSNPGHPYIYPAEMLEVE